MGSVAILTGEKKFEHFFLIKNFFWKKKIKCQQNKKVFATKKIRSNSCCA